jgi:hypothetical protein
MYEFTEEERGQLRPEEERDHLKKLKILEQQITVENPGNQGDFSWAKKRKTARRFR